MPPGCHQRNAAEVAIHNLNTHFLSVLAGVTDSSPPSLSDQLLPQTQITINLTWQSHATQNVSAYAHLSGPFDYNNATTAHSGGMQRPGTQEGGQSWHTGIPFS